MPRLRSGAAAASTSRTRIGTRSRARGGNAGAGTTGAVSTPTLFLPDPPSFQRVRSDEVIEVSDEDMDSSSVNNRVVPGSNNGDEGEVVTLDDTEESFVSSSPVFALSNLAQLMSQRQVGGGFDIEASNFGDFQQQLDSRYLDVSFDGASPEGASQNDNEVMIVQDISVPARLHIPSALLEGSNPSPDNDPPSSVPSSSSSTAAAVPGSSNAPSGQPPVNEDDVDTVEESDGEDDEESSGPPHKMAKLETSVRSDDDDGFTCQICYEPFTNSGGHRVCCLKCGHIYGKDCIERWVKTSKRCPACNCKATVSQIRVLYVKNLKVIDTSELDRLKGEVDRLNVEKSKIELRNSQLRFKEEMQFTEINRLNREIQILNRRKPEVIDIAADSSASSSRTLSESNLNNQSSSSGSGYLQMPKLQLIKRFEIKEGQSRVGAYNEWMNLLVVSHSIANALFPGGSYGIRKINALDMKPSMSFPIHQRALRDMSFCSSQTDLLLTVGLDKKAVLFNCNSNCAVQTFVTPSALWSCCWNTVNQNIFYVGSMTGAVTSYDIRAPQEPLSNLTIPTTEKGGVGRLRFVPPAYQSQSFNMSGLIIQKLNSIWFAEMLGGITSSDGPRYHQLPLEGPFVNADFEAASRHVLVSSRPKMHGLVRTGTNHVVCTLGKSYSTTEERDVFSCDVVQNFYGGFQESSILCRSALFSPQQGQVYVAANGEGAKTVRVWDIANAEQKTLVRINQDAALDFVHGSVNETNFLGIVTDKSMDVYDVKK